MAGVVAVIGYDGVMTLAETELLRTVCALLHCSLPLLDLAGSRQPYCLTEPVPEAENNPPGDAGAEVSSFAAVVVIVPLVAEVLLPDAQARSTRLESVRLEDLMYGGRVDNVDAGIVCVSSGPQLECCAYNCLQPDRCGHERQLASAGSTRRWFGPSIKGPCRPEAQRHRRTWDLLRRS